MPITRRKFMSRTGALAAALALPARSFAASTLSLGDAKLTTLSDGHLVLPGDFILGGMPQDEMKAIMAKYNLPSDRLEPPCNVTLFQDGTRNVLFDVGSGPDFMPTAGKLTEALDAAGLSPDDITHVVFTHAHPDHLWGLLDEFDDPLFANAEYMMGSAEFDYWANPETVNTIGEARTTFAVGAARRLEVVAEQMKMIEDGQEVIPGIIARATFGHTPGHLAFILHGGSTAAMVTGDALGNHHVAFERPDWASGSDQDGPMAAETRVSLLDQITSDNMQIVGFHLPGGGVGSVERQGQTYRYIEGN